MSKLFLVGAFLSFGILGPAHSGNPHDGLCADLNGAPFGLCLGASNLGCGTDAEHNSQACASIEKSYYETTGELPPWLAECPCMTPEELAALRYVGLNDSVDCINNSDAVSISIGWNIHYPASLSWDYAAGGGVGWKLQSSGPGNIGCGFWDQCTDGGCQNISRNISISEQEFYSCAARWIDAGLARGIECFTE